MLVFTCRTSDKHCEKILCMKTDEETFFLKKPRGFTLRWYSSTDGYCSRPRELVFHLKIKS